MKKLIYAIIAFSFLFTSCSADKMLDRKQERAMKRSDRQQRKICDDVHNKHYMIGY